MKHRRSVSRSLVSVLLLLFGLLLYPHSLAQAGDVTGSWQFDGNLEAAVGRAPGWPENHLLLAEAFAEDGRDDEAANALAAAQAKLSDPAFAAWRTTWNAMAEALQSR